MSEHSVSFYDKMNVYYSNKNKRKPWTSAELKEIAAQILSAKQMIQQKSRRQYHLLSLYDVLEIGNEQLVIKKGKSKEKNHVYIVAYENLFDMLHQTHISVGHGGRDKMIHSLQKKYDIPRCAVEKFIETCEVCKLKKNMVHSNVIVKPTISCNFNSRGQVDLIDFQSCPDREFTWLLNYQDLLTKFLFLRPLKSKTAGEVAKELLKIFLEIGAPSILQSGTERELINSTLSELVKMWPSLRILHGRPQHANLQENNEKSKQDVENMIRAWMLDNNSTNWSMGCYFVQFQKNSLFNEVIGRTPYRALFKVDPKVGLATDNLPTHLLDSMNDEDELIRFLEIPYEEQNRESVSYDDNHDPLTCLKLEVSNEESKQTVLTCTSNEESMHHQDSTNKIGLLGNAGHTINFNDTFLAETVLIKTEFIQDPIQQYPSTVDTCVTRTESGRSECKNETSITLNSATCKGQKRAAKRRLTNAAKCCHLCL